MEGFEVVVGAGAVLEAGVDEAALEVVGAALEEALLLAAEEEALLPEAEPDAEEEPDEPPPFKQLESAEWNDRGQPLHIFGGAGSTYNRS